MRSRIVSDQKAEEPPRVTVPPPPPRQPDHKLKGYIERGNKRRPSDVQTEMDRDQA